MSLEWFLSGVRNYDPQTGRFLQPDPFKGYLSEPASQNPYMYCRGNPVKYSDPSGYSYNADTKKQWEELFKLVKKSPTAQKIIQKLSDSKNVWTLIRGEDTGRTDDLIHTIYIPLFNDKRKVLQHFGHELGHAEDIENDPHDFKARQLGTSEKYKNLDGNKLYWLIEGPAYDAENKIMNECQKK